MFRSRTQPTGNEVPPEVPRPRTLMLAGKNRANAKSTRCLASTCNHVEISSRSLRGDMAAPKLQSSNLSTPRGTRLETLVERKAARHVQSDPCAIGPGWRGLAIGTPRRGTFRGGPPAPPAAFPGRWPSTLRGQQAGSEPDGSIAPRFGTPGTGKRNDQAAPEGTSRRNPGMSRTTSVREGSVPATSGTGTGECRNC